MPSIDLPPNVSSPRRARAFVDGLLVDRFPGTSLDDVRLVVSELVANVVVHARTTMVVSVDVDGDDVCVAVRDFSTDLPRQRPIHTGSTADRGLHILDGVTEEWSVRVLPDGKVVEARLRGR